MRIGWKLITSACQSEPVEDSRAEAYPPCFDELSMTPLFNYVGSTPTNAQSPQLYRNDTLLNIFPYASLIPSSPGAWICCRDNGISFFVLR